MSYDVLYYEVQVVDRDLFNKYFGQVWTFTESIQPKNYRSVSSKNKKSYLDDNVLVFPDSSLINKISNLGD